MNPTSRNGEVCEDPRCRSQDKPVWYCVDCACSLCEECWGFQLPHKDGRTGRDGLPHERTRYQRFKELDHILNPPVTADAIEQLHNSDLDMTWFGVRKDGRGKPSFIDYDIYSALMGQYSTLQGSRTRSQYPQLVSFIGQTNAGKSTLIKMLIAISEQKLKGITRGSFPSPVVGSVENDRTPTSADVHLYADPGTYNGMTPLLYADCEGLDAGEELPIGAIERRITPFDVDRSLSRLTPGRARKLQWAKTPATSSREYIVGELYPRILYTFSDVVVFVLRNAKAFQSTALRRLLEWGAASLEKSVNQPALPHAIIVLNASDVGIDASQWGVRTATEVLLEANRESLDSLNGVPYFRQLADHWRSKGKLITSISDLIHCYYSTFKVVRIPVKGRYQMLYDQIVRLQKAITDSCEESFGTKRRGRMLSTSDELNVYLQSAFAHFSRTLDIPFNFVEVSLTSNPIPDDFGGHILQLATAIQAQRAHKYINGRHIFDNLADLVASCIMLDCARHRKGSVEGLFAEYEDSLQYALINFCSTYSTCEFRVGQEVCVNVASAHEKGHQNAKGKIISTGPFVSNYTFDDYYPEWREAVLEATHHIHEDLQDFLSNSSKELSEEYHVLQRHTRIMKAFFDNVFFEHYSQQSSADLVISHSTCFCCLMRPPQHALPCGHVLCTHCIRSYGRTLGSNRFILQMNYCPLHRLQTQWKKPHRVHFKPDFAGVRLLCLDGGGMRGIVELEVLRAIQKELHDDIPLRAFFDLIVGTSTGGIISLAFGAKNWDLDDCILRFEQLCSKAFAPRDFSKLPIIKHLVTMKHAAKYKTKPLRKVLQDSFGHDSLFGSTNEDGTATTTRVAVTATDEAGKKAIVIANYSREIKGRMDSYAANYDFPRPGRPDLELRIWEAAAATSAAPSYFKPFVHDPTRRTFLDGALYHNNPVRLAERERKLLWPDVAKKHPDILLSIGTARKGGNLDVGISNKQTSGEETFSGYDHNSLQEPAFIRKSTWAPFPRLRQAFKVLHNRIDNILDAETTWKDFVEDVASQSAAKSRYFRINPDLGHEPPRLDDISQLRKLQEDTRDALKIPESRAQIEMVAHTLIASCFYFEKLTSPVKERDKVYTCGGRICCRFENTSKYLRSLGDYLREQQLGDFQPYFEIESDATLATDEKVLLSSDIIIGMSERAWFNLNLPTIRARKQTSQVTIYLVLQGQYVHRSNVPISGFPRTVMAENPHQSLLDTIQAETGRMSTSQLRRKLKDKPLHSPTSSVDSPKGSSSHIVLPAISKPKRLSSSSEISQASPSESSGDGILSPMSSMRSSNSKSERRSLPEVLGRSSRMITSEQQDQTAMSDDEDDAYTADEPSTATL